VKCLVSRLRIKAKNIKGKMKQQHQNENINPGQMGGHKSGVHGKSSGNLAGVGSSGYVSYKQHTAKNRNNVKQ